MKTSLLEIENVDYTLTKCILKGYTSILWQNHHQKTNINCGVTGLDEVMQ